MDSDGGVRGGVQVLLRVGVVPPQQHNAVCFRGCEVSGPTWGACREKSWSRLSDRSKGSAIKGIYWQYLHFKFIAKQNMTSWKFYEKWFIPNIHIVLTIEKWQCNKEMALQFTLLPTYAITEASSGYPLMKGKSQLPSSFEFKLCFFYASK